MSNHPISVIKARGTYREVGRQIGEQCKPLSARGRRHRRRVLRHPGDMIDYIYGLQQRDHPTKRLYATFFEFGTLGDTLYGLFQSPRVMIHENRAFWHGAVNEQIHAEAKRGFEELFNPSAADWKEKAVKDTEQAFDVILKAEGFV